MFPNKMVVVGVFLAGLCVVASTAGKTISDDSELASILQDPEVLSIFYAPFFVADLLLVTFDALAGKRSNRWRRLWNWPAQLVSCFDLRKSLNTTSIFLWTVFSRNKSWTDSATTSTLKSWSGSEPTGSSARSTPFHASESNLFTYVRR